MFFGSPSCLVVISCCLVVSASAHDIIKDVFKDRPVLVNILKNTTRNNNIIKRLNAKNVTLEAIRSKIKDFPNEKYLEARFESNTAPINSSGETNFRKNWAFKKNGVLQLSTGKRKSIVGASVGRGNVLPPTEESDQRDYKAFDNQTKIFSLVSTIMNKLKELNSSDHEPKTQLPKFGIERRLFQSSELSQEVTDAPKPTLSNKQSVFFRENDLEVPKSNTEILVLLITEAENKKENGGRVNDSWIPLKEKPYSVFKQTKISGVAPLESEADSIANISKNTLVHNKPSEVISNIQSITTKRDSTENEEHPAQNYQENKSNILKYRFLNYETGALNNQSEYLKSLDNPKNVTISKDRQQENLLPKHGTPLPNSVATMYKQQTSPKKDLLKMPGNNLAHEKQFITNLEQKFPAEMDSINLHEAPVDKPENQMVLINLPCDPNCWRSYALLFPEANIPNQISADYGTNLDTHKIITKLKSRGQIFQMNDELNNGDAEILQMSNGIYNPKTPLVHQQNVPKPNNDIEPENVKTEKLSNSQGGVRIFSNLNYQSNPNIDDKPSNFKLGREIYPDTDNISGKLSQSFTETLFNDVPENLVKNKPLDKKPEKGDILQLKYLQADPSSIIEVQRPADDESMEKKSILTGKQEIIDGHDASGNKLSPNFQKQTNENTDFNNTQPKNLQPSIFVYNGKPNILENESIDDITNILVRDNKNEDGRVSSDRLDTSPTNQRDESLNTQYYQPMNVQTLYFGDTKNSPSDDNRNTKIVSVKQRNSDPQTNLRTSSIYNFDIDSLKEPNLDNGAKNIETEKIHPQFLPIEGYQKANGRSGDSAEQLSTHYQRLDPLSTTPIRNDFRQKNLQTSALLLGYSDDWEDQKLADETKDDAMKLRNASPHNLVVQKEKIAGQNSDTKLDKLNTTNETGNKNITNDDHYLQTKETFPLDDLNLQISIPVDGEEKAKIEKRYHPQIVLVRTHKRNSTSKNYKLHKSNPNYGSELLNYIPKKYFVVREGVESFGNNHDNSQLKKLQPTKSIYFGSPTILKDKTVGEGDNHKIDRGNKPSELLTQSIFDSSNSLEDEPFGAGDNQRIGKLLEQANTPSELRLKVSPPNYQPESDNNKNSPIDDARSTKMEKIVPVEARQQNGQYSSSNEVDNLNFFDGNQKNSDAQSNLWVSSDTVNPSRLMEGENQSIKSQNANPIQLKMLLPSSQFLNSKPYQQSYFRAQNTSPYPNKLENGVPLLESIVKEMLLSIKRQSSDQQKTYDQTKHQWDYQMSKAFRPRFKIRDIPRILRAISRRYTRPMREHILKKLINSLKKYLSPSESAPSMQVSKQIWINNKQYFVIGDKPMKYVKTPVNYRPDLHAEEFEVDSYPEEPKEISVDSPEVQDVSINDSNVIEGEQHPKMGMSQYPQVSKKSDIPVDTDIENYTDIKNTEMVSNDNDIGSEVAKAASLSNPQGGEWIISNFNHQPKPNIIYKPRDFKLGTEIYPDILSNNNDRQPQSTDIETLLNHQDGGAMISNLNHQSNPNTAYEPRNFKLGTNIYPDTLSNNNDPEPEKMEVERLSNAQGRGRKVLNLYHQEKPHVIYDPGNFQLKTKIHPYLQITENQPRFEQSINTLTFSPDAHTNQQSFADKISTGFQSHFKLNAPVEPADIRWQFSNTPTYKRRKFQPEILYPLNVELKQTQPDNEQLKMGIKGTPYWYKRYYSTEMPPQQHVLTHYLPQQPWRNNKRYFVHGDKSAELVGTLPVDYQGDIYPEEFDVDTYTGETKHASVNSPEVQNSSINGPNVTKDEEPKMDMLQEPQVSKMPDVSPVNDTDVENTDGSSNMEPETVKTQKISNPQGGVRIITNYNHQSKFNTGFKPANFNLGREISSETLSNNFTEPEDMEAEILSNSQGGRTMISNFNHQSNPNKAYEPRDFNLGINIYPDTLSNNKENFGTEQENTEVERLTNPQVERRMISNFNLQSSSNIAYEPRDFKLGTKIYPLSNNDTQPENMGVESLANPQGGRRVLNFYQQSKRYEPEKFESGRQNDPYIQIMEGQPMEEKSIYPSRIQTKSSPFYAHTNPQSLVAKTSPKHPPGFKLNLPIKPVGSQEWQFSNKPNDRRKLQSNILYRFNIEPKQPQPDNDQSEMEIKETPYWHKGFYSTEKPAPQKVLILPSNSNDINDKPVKLTNQSEMTMQDMPDWHKPNYPTEKPFLQKALILPSNPKDTEDKPVKLTNQSEITIQNMPYWFKRYYPTKMPSIQGVSTSPIITGNVFKAEPVKFLSNIQKTQFDYKPNYIESEKPNPLLQVPSMKYPPNFALEETDLPTQIKDLNLQPRQNPGSQFLITMPPQNFIDQPYNQSLILNDSNKHIYAQKPDGFIKYELGSQNAMQNHQPGQVSSVKDVKPSNAYPQAKDPLKIPVPMYQDPVKNVLNTNNLVQRDKSKSARLESDVQLENIPKRETQGTDLFLYSKNDNVKEGQPPKSIKDFTMQRPSPDSPSNAYTQTRDPLKIPVSMHPPDQVKGVLNADGLVQKLYSPKFARLETDAQLESLPKHEIKEGNLFSYSNNENTRDPPPESVPQDLGMQHPDQFSPMKYEVLNVYPQIKDSLKIPTPISPENQINDVLNTEDLVQEFYLPKFDNLEADVQLENLSKDETEETNLFPYSNNENATKLSQPFVPQKLFQPWNYEGIKHVSGTKNNWPITWLESSLGKLQNAPNVFVENTDEPKNAQHLTPPKEMPDETLISKPSPQGLPSNIFSKPQTSQLGVYPLSFGEMVFKKPNQIKKNQILYKPDNKKLYDLKWKPQTDSDDTKDCDDEKPKDVVILFKQTIYLNVGSNKTAHNIEKEVLVKNEPTSYNHTSFGIPST